MLEHGWKGFLHQNQFGARGLFIALGVVLIGCADSPSVQANPSPGADAVPAQILRVVDGDTVEVRVGGETKKVRLAEIDAPETRQPWGSESTAALRRSLGGGAVALEVVDTDRYGRLVAIIWQHGESVNHAMVREGQAWAYTEYARDVRVIEMEDEARTAGRGLWSLPEAERQAPWAWRRARRGGAPPKVVDPRCSKRVCSEMADCAEARFHLESCGRSSLDGDADGVPCEALCSGMP
jgi:endonuclease YncB( thermonuclease family)